MSEYAAQEIAGRSRLLQDLQEGAPSPRSEFAPCGVTLIEMAERRAAVRQWTRGRAIRQDHGFSLSGFFHLKYSH